MRRAFTLLIKRDRSRQPIAEVVSIEDGTYVSYDFDDWVELSMIRRRIAPADHDWVRAVRFHLAAPRIIRILRFAKLPRQEVKFNRRNVLVRDDHRCQYCGKRFPSGELTLDHVVPRSRTGPTTWDNVVCACPRCNVRKGGRTPSEAGLRLLRNPAKPRHNPVVRMTLADRRYAVWRPFLEGADWNIERA